MKHELILEGLNCAHCAAKIEEKLKNTDGYENVSFSFATKALSIECADSDIQADVQSIVDSIEDGVTVKKAGEAPQDEEEESVSRSKLILLAGSVILLIAAVLLRDIPWLNMALSALAVIASGYEVVIEGVRSAFKLRLDETTLMTVAVIAAMALGEFTEAAAVTVLFGIGELLEDRAVEKSRRDIRRLADIRPDTAVIYDGGDTREVQAKDVPLGAVIEIAPHTRVPLDCVVTQGSSTVDSSSLTGESAPVDVAVGSQLLSGMLNNDRTILAQTTQLYADSAATRIVRLVEDSSKNKGSGEKLITRFARIYTPSVILLGALIAVIPSLITGDWATWLKRALVCLVASCPCSIVISVPLAYFAGIGAASKTGVLIKGGRFVESIASAKSFCFDKTGTLTDNNIAVSEVKPLGDHSAEEIISIAASAELHSAHPVAEAIKEYAKSRDIPLKKLTDHAEIPAVGVSAKDSGRLVTCGKADGFDGVTVSIDGEAIGVITVSESVRPEAQSVIAQLKELGAENVTMLSGDRREACERVGKKLGVTRVYSELLPEDKVDRVEKLIDRYGGCCFVGDGINDAPVLSRASCGIAMGLGSEAAIESADTVLSSGNLSALPRAVRLCRSTIGAVKVNIAFSLAVKALVIALAAFGIAPLWLAVLSDTGVCLLCVLNSVRLIRSKRGSQRIDI